MANHGNQSYVNEVVDGAHREAVTTEIEDRAGVFDHFSSKKNDDNIKQLPHHQDNDDGFKVDEEKRHDGDQKGENKKHGFLEKLHRSNSCSSSSSDEEEADEEKRKKKEKKEKITGEDQKGIFEKIKEKLPRGGHDEHEKKVTHSSQDENKGILEKIKEKLPGHHHKEDEAHDSR